MKYFNRLVLAICMIAVGIITVADQSPIVAFVEQAFAIYIVNESLGWLMIIGGCLILRDIDSPLFGFYSLPYLVYAGASISYTLEKRALYIGAVVNTAFYIIAFREMFTHRTFMTASDTPNAATDKRNIRIMSNWKTWPIIAPLLKLLQSRAAFILIVNAVLVLIAAARPDAAAAIQNLYPIIIASIALIFKIGIEDAARALASAPKTPAEALASAVNESLQTVVSPNVGAHIPQITPALVEAILRDLGFPLDAPLTPAQLAEVVKRVTSVRAEVRETKAITVTT